MMSYAASSRTPLLVVTVVPQLRFTTSLPRLVQCRHTLVLARLYRHTPFPVLQNTRVCAGDTRSSRELTDQEHSEKTGAPPPSSTERHSPLATDLVPPYPPSVPDIP
eukprot:3273905-Rhodomonas_salina.1